MISWIQKYFHKHLKLVLFVILLVVGLPMVFVFTPSSGTTHAAPKTLTQPFFGHDLANSDTARRVFGDANYSIILKAGYQALQGPQMQEYALQRVAGLALAEELRLPAPTQEQISAHIARLPLFQGEQGQFDQQRYKQFGDALKGNPQFGAADAARVFRDDTRLDQLQKLLGGPGYVLPGEVRDQLARADSTWTIQLASLDYASFDPGAAATEDALAKFFEDNSFRYQVPERLRLSLVEFKGADFLPPGAPAEEQLRNFYNANPARFPVPADAEKKDEAPKLSLTPEAPAAPGDDFTKVRAQVEAALRQEAGLNSASQAANDFTVALYENKIPANSPQLSTLLAARRLTAAPLPPFAPEAPPENLAWAAGAYEQLSRLDSDRHYSDAVRTPGGFAVFLWSETLPSYKPMLSEVREKVAADWRDNDKRKRFVEHGKTLKAQLEAAVRAGTAFEKAAIDARLEVKTHAGFTLRQPPQDVPFPIFSALQGKDARAITDMVATNEKGFLAFVQEKKPPDLAETGARYGEVRDQLARMNAGSTGSAALTALVGSELRKSAPADATP